MWCACLWFSNNLICVYKRFSLSFHSLNVLFYRYKSTSNMFLCLFGKRNLFFSILLILRFTSYTVYMVYMRMAAGKEWHEQLLLILSYYEFGMTNVSFFVTNDVQVIRLFLLSPLFSSLFTLHSSLFTSTFHYFYFHRIYGPCHTYVCPIPPHCSLFMPNCLKFNFLHSIRRWKQYHCKIYGNFVWCFYWICLKNFIRIFLEHFFAFAILTLFHWFICFILNINWMIFCFCFIRSPLVWNRCEWNWNWNPL